MIEMGRLTVRNRTGGTGRVRVSRLGATLRTRGEVAQLVEHTAENRGVAGSSPALAIPRSLRVVDAPERPVRTIVDGFERG